MKILGKMARRFSLVPLLALTAGSGIAPLNAQPVGPETGMAAPASDSQALNELSLDAPGLEKAKAAAGAGDQDGLKKAYLEYRRAGKPAKWNVMPEDQPAAASEKDDPLGDEVCSHLIRNRFGFDPWVDMGKDFDWKYNPAKKDSPHFTNEWTHGAISRMGFWDQLGNAYWKTRNEKYAIEWVSQLNDFVHKNPVDSSRQLPSLWRTLDAAIRMSDSWPNAYYHFLDSPSFTPEAQWIYLKSIIDHAGLLEAGLADARRTGNWVTTECLGLYTIGALFPELKKAASWRKVAMDRLATELERTVPPDGFEVELTPHYHYVSLADYANALKLAKLNNLAVPAGFHSKILAMYQAPVLVMDQSGKVVPTNDSTIEDAAQNAREGLEVAGSDPLLEWAASKGAKGLQPADSTMLPYAGFYAMRGGWKPDDLFLFFRGGPAGLAHEHEDMLQIVLRAWGKTLLFDPGNAAYDHSDWRRFILGTSSHNTIIVDGKEQHRGSNKDIIITEPCHNPWITTPTVDYVSATYDKGYQQNLYDPKQEYKPLQWIGNLDHSVSHTRRVLFLKPYYALVLDTLDGTGLHTFDAHFHMNAQSARIDGETQAVFSQSAAGPQLGLYSLDPEHLAVDIVQGQKTPLLGWLTEHHAIPTARFRKQQEAPAVFATFLYPFFGQKPTFSASRLNAEGADLWQRALSTSLEQVEIVLAKNNLPHEMAISSELVGKVYTKATGVVFRKLPTKEGVYKSGWGVTAYEDKQWRFTSSEPASLAWLESAGKMLLFNAGSQSCSLTLARPFQSRVDLPPGRWTEITGNGATAAPAPELFPALQRVASSAPAYGEYLKSQPEAEADPASSPVIHIEAATMALPKWAVIKAKKGAEKAVVGWNEAASKVTMQVNVPEAGFYRLKLRYCAQGEPVRSVWIGGKVPFAEAGRFVLPSTQGAFPSDGWSNEKDDWKEIVLGNTGQSQGWKFYLPKGPVELSLCNEDGEGSSLDWLELARAKN